MSLRDAPRCSPEGHARRPYERPFTRRERERVTLLFGGLPRVYQALIEAAMAPLGYRTKGLPTPTKADCHRGREFCNYGMCNPAYFTIGALLNFLIDLRDREGIPTEEIVNDYAFVTAGSCGPCRFGMYESEYRLALRNAGFDGFRVLIFQQTADLDGCHDAGLEINLRFVLAFANAALLGDLLNDALYHVRPYETRPGATDHVFAEVQERVADAMRTELLPRLRCSRAGSLLDAVLPGARIDELRLLLGQVLKERYVDVLRDSARLINEEVEVDYTQPKPVCKIAGEFWAQRTDGDGNFNMFAFLESEGAEALVEPTMTWAHFLLEQGLSRLILERRLARCNGDRYSIPAAFAHWKSYMRIRFARALFRREQKRLHSALGGVELARPSQAELRRLSAPYYDSRAQGGDAYMEIGETIYYTQRRLAHMVLGLKPFGCLPSTQSDGAQAAVAADYPDIIYLPVETAVEGETNAYSRVQMVLEEAKVRCREEFEACVARTGYAIEAIRAYCRARPHLRRPLQRIPRREGVVGRAANFVLHVGEQMRRDGIPTCAGVRHPAGASSTRRAAAPSPGPQYGESAGG